MEYSLLPRSFFDRSLVKNLFLTYLSSQDKRKKDDIAQLIGKILEIPPKELNKVNKSYCF